MWLLARKSVQVPQEARAGIREAGEVDGRKCMTSGFLSRDNSVSTLPDTSKIWISVFNTPALKWWERNSPPCPCTLTTNTRIQQYTAMWSASSQSLAETITREADVCLGDANLIEAWAVTAKHEASVASNSFLTSHRRFYMFKDPMSQSRVTRKATTATRYTLEHLRRQIEKGVIDSADV